MNDKKRARKASPYETGGTVLSKPAIKFCFSQEIILYETGETHPKFLKATIFHFIHHLSA